MLYENIKNSAKARGYSVRKIELILNYSNGTIYGWKKNNSAPSSKLKHVADLLNTTVDELLKERGDKHE